MEQGSPLENYLEKLASETSAPGTGNGIAVSGAMAASILAKICRVTLSSSRHSKFWDALHEPLAQCDSLREILLDLSDRDIQFDENFRRALNLPRESEAEKQARKEAIQQSLKQSTTISLEIAEKCKEIQEAASNIAKYTASHAVADAGVASLLAEGAQKAAALYARSFFPRIKDKDFILQMQKSLLELEDGMEERRLRTILLAECRMEEG